jgi:hypothetical protein
LASYNELYKIYKKNGGKQTFKAFSEIKANAARKKATKPATIKHTQQRLAQAKKTAPRVKPKSGVVRNKRNLI